MIRTPNGMMAEEDVLSLFDQVGFTPPAGASTEQAFQILMREAQRQAEEERSGKRPGRVRPGEHCPPRHPTHLEPSTLDLKSTLRRGEQ